MCGILGIRRTWNADSKRAQRALEALAWRGRDGSRLEKVGDWVLGVARLAITDRSGAQPVRCSQSGRVVALNGAITSAAVEWPEYADRCATRNDAELLLARHAARGPGALGDMTGPYAFAIVDPDAGTLFLGRDPEGEKPLYVATERGRVVAFASTVAALRELEISVELPPEERARLLRFGFCLDPRGGGDGIEVHSLDPGIWIEREGRPLERLATVPPAVRGGPFGDAVRAAVQRCETAEVPVGLTLSGGVDSACIAVSVSRPRLPAYQFCANGAPPDERRRAEQIASLTGHELRPVDGGPDILRALPEITRAVGLPLGDPSILAAHAVALAAAQDGVRVLLSGEGSDDLLLGYRRHRAAAWLPRRGLRWLPAPPRFAMGTAARMWRAVRADQPYDELLQVSPPGFARLVGAAGSEVPTLPSAGEMTALDRAREVDRLHYLRRDLLPKLDAATLFAGVEGRCPVLDPAVLASDAVNVEDARMILGKRPLRDAFEHELPEGFFDQRKTGFAVPLDRWLREDSFLIDVLLDSRTLARPHLDAAGVRRAVDMHRQGRARLGHALYLVAALELYDRSLEESAA